MEQYVPSKMVRTNTKQPWINHSIVQLRRRKQRSYNEAKLSNLASDWIKYKLIKGVATVYTYYNNLPMQ